MRLIQLLLIALVFTVPAAAQRGTDDPLNIRALLVIASNQGGKSDPALSRYEPTLRRILRFDTYKLAGQGSARIGEGGGSITLARGHSLELEAEKSGGRGARIRANWEAGGRSLMNTGLVLRPGVPAVLGGPSTGTEGEVWAIIIVAD